MSLRMSLEARASKMMPRHVHGYITKSFLKQVGSNRVSCHFNTTAKRIFLLLMLIRSFDRTCFITVLHRCASHKVRQLVIEGFGSEFYKNRRVTKALVRHTIHQ